MAPSRWLLAALPVATAVLVAGCGGGTSSSGTAAGSSSAQDSHPLGDISDNQVYVPYSPADAAFSVKVPEGWSRSDVSTGVAFTDKLHTVSVQRLQGRPQPTPDSVRGGELADVQKQGNAVAVGTVETKTLPAGSAVHATYSADSPPDPVTGKTTKDDVELYVFWRNGTEVLLTLSAPKGGDNVDPWRIISTSFAWK
jgi:hypothetical protein